nr:2473_t:CDS:10 [Entrophospora candida]
MKRLVVFDFDGSLIDENSDTWIFEQLSIETAEKLDKLYGKIQWTDLMDKLLGELHQKGITRQQIEHAFTKIPFRSKMIEALKTIKKLNGDIIILSDANTVYIEEILKAYDVYELISDIISNPAEWNEDGRLRVQRLYSPNDPPHGCENKCALNICKGRELLKFLSKCEVKYQQIIYVGDSLNDFCPATKMSSNDLFLVRKGLELEKFLKNGSDSCKPKYKGLKNIINPRIIYWNDANDVYNIIEIEFETLKNKFQKNDSGSEIDFDEEMKQFQDLDMPNSLITKIIENAIGNHQIENNAKLAIIKSITPFIKLISKSANEIAKDNSHKNIIADDVFKALDSNKFKEFIPRLKDELKVFQAEQKLKKNSESNNGNNNNSNSKLKEKRSKISSSNNISTIGTFEKIKDVT